MSTVPDVESDPVLEVRSEIRAESAGLKRESKSMRFRHQFYTVTTILLGVIAPAVVTYTPPPDIILWWKPVAIVVTAIATASATIRTVLRYGDRYSNSALTAIALDDLLAQLNTKREEVLVQVKPEYIPQKLSEYAAWARKELFALKKAYVEKEVSAMTKERIEFSEPPAIATEQKTDPSRRLLSPAAK